ncbi:Gti1/Pac2 family domain containing protein, partial [Rhypophila sp. PSN 637]
MSSFTAPDNTAPQNGDGGRSSSTPIPLPTITLSGVYLRNILDFILILQACLDRKLPFIKHRPKGEGIATSGSVYVYETQSSRITRWTDDKTLKWSPSRVLNSSLVYREIDISTDVQHGFQETYDSTDVQHGSHETYDSVLTGAHTEPSKYKYKSLMKKTMTFRIQGKEYHVINYYSL